jgi:hypothetical protein
MDRVRYSGARLNHGYDRDHLALQPDLEVRLDSYI